MDAFNTITAQQAAKENAGSIIRLITQDIALGRKICAIKTLREHTGWGLKEAKDAVEALIDAAQRMPDHYPVPEKPKTYKVVVCHYGDTRVIEASDRLSADSEGRYWVDQDGVTSVDVVEVVATSKLTLVSK